jgi:hypothetical protein
MGLSKTNYKDYGGKSALPGILMKLVEVAIP